MENRWGRGTDVGVGWSGGGEPGGPELETGWLGGWEWGWLWARLLRILERGGPRRQPGLPKPGAEVGVRVGGGGRTLFGRKGRPLSWQEAALRTEGGDCCSSSGWWASDVAEGCLLPSGRQRAREHGAGDTSTIVLVCLAAS